MMNIFEIKDHVFQLEQKGKRMPVFAYLKKAWDSDTPSESSLNPLTDIRAGAIN